MRVKRHSTGSLLLDKRSGKWRYQWWDGEIHRSKTIGTKQQYPNKATAWTAVKATTRPSTTPRNGETVAEVIASYKLHRMPSIMRRHAYTVRSWRTTSSPSLAACS